MKRLYYLIRLILKRKVKWSFCSGCMCKRWKLRGGYMQQEGKETVRVVPVLTCGICDTFSYT